jgi:S1-C subfamily serine protease
MRRKLFLAFVLFTLTCGTAFAAVNGLYNGRPIVRVFVDGQEVKSTVPGQIIDGSTMLPLRAVAEALGAYVEWDQATYSAKITTPEIIIPPEAQPSLSLAELNKIGESVPIIYALDSTGRYFSQGSGFVYNDLIITNHHVVAGAAQIEVRFGGKVEKVAANLVFDNPDADLAAFRLPGYPSLKLAKTEPKKGDKVYVLGYPDSKFTLSEGTIQSVLEFDYDYSAIVSDADTAPGSSGGVMVNSSGEVFGIIRGGHGIHSNALHVKHLVEELSRL